MKLKFILSILLLTGITKAQTKKYCDVDCPMKIQPYKSYGIKLLKLPDEKEWVEPLWRDIHVEGTPYCQLGYHLDWKVENNGKNITISTQLCKKDEINNNGWVVAKPTPISILGSCLIINNEYLKEWF